MSSSKFKDNPADFNQRMMFPTNIFDLLPADHDCFVFEDIFRHIDTADKANSSKYKAMSYRRLKEKEAELIAEVEVLIKKAEASDNEEDEAYQQETGYSIPDDLTFKQQRLEKIQKARKALEEREQALNPNKTIDDKKQISFADHDARIMEKKAQATSTVITLRSVLTAMKVSLLVNTSASMPMTNRKSNRRWRQLPKQQITLPLPK